MTSPPRHYPSPRLWARLSIVYSLLILPAGICQAADQLIRIGTGSTAGTYYQMGKAISAVISNPERGSDLTCDEGGSCGVPGLIAVVQASDGSVQNISNIENRVVDMGLAQADIAFQAFSGTGAFETFQAQENLRALAYLFPVEMHIIAQAKSPIQSVADMREARISMGAFKSGTLINARGILAAHQIPESDFRRRFLDEERAIDHLLQDRLDVLFSMTGAPSLGLTYLAQTDQVRFLSISADQRAQIFEDNPHLFRTIIPAETYGTEHDIDTIAVAALLVVGAHIDEETVYQITHALWHPYNRDVLRRGHEKALRLSVLEALTNIPIPLHNGAARFYNALSEGVYGAQFTPK